MTPSAIAAGGDAIARQDDGRVIFVSGALPGERVRAQVHTIKKDYAKATVVEVVDPSADRAEPPCAAHRRGCGGCPWQHVERAAQRRLKRDIVADALRRIGHFDDGEIEVRSAASGPTALRTTIRVAVDPSGRGGHRRSQSHDAVPTDACAAAHPRLEELLVEARFPGAAEVVLRVGLAGGERAADPDAAMAAAVVPADVALGSDASVHEEIAGVRFRISMASFFQAGPAAAEALVAEVDAAVGDALPRGGHLVDAYAGVGLFAATIALRRGATVTAVENNESAAADARVNLGFLEAEICDVEVGRWRHKGSSVDVIVADPARPGLGRPGVAALVAADPARLVLVSCDPASLARDARLLADSGYHPSGSVLVDAFPDTVHLEAVTRFDRR